MLRNMTSIYIEFNGEMLLLYRIGSRVGEPSWRGIGGHFEKDELNNPRACILRELSEEIGIMENDIKALRLKYITLHMTNNEIRQNYYYFAELLNTEININECDEGILEWVNINEVLNRKMPVTAKECLKHYLSKGKNDNKLYAGVATKDGVRFIELSDF